MSKDKPTKDEDIDTSDIPELTDEFWDNAKIVMPRDKPVGSCYERFEKDLAESFRDDDRDSLEYNNSEEENDNQ